MLFVFIMKISVLTFIITIICALALGVLLGYFLYSGMDNFGNRFKRFTLRIRNRLVDYWYVLVLFTTSVYVMLNFSSCIDLHFTEEFNGKNLIFLFWLVLIIFPMFDGFEGFGISIKKRKQEKKENSLTSEYLDVINKVQKEGGQHE